MSITTTGNALLPIRRDGQISGGISALGGGGSSSMGGGGGITAHSALSQLDYASSGHTGFLASADGIAYDSYRLGGALANTYAPLASPTFTGNVKYNQNDSWIQLNRTATTNYLGIVNSTNEVDKWYQGLREISPFNDSYHFYNFTNDIDVLTLSENGHVSIPRSLHVGGTSDPGADNLFIDGLSQHPSFSSGWTGSNWQITAAGDATFDNLMVKGSARFRELIIDQLSVIGGSDLLSIARGKIVSVDIANSKVTLEDPNGRGTSAFAVGDFFWIKGIDIDNTTFTDCKGQISAITGVTLTLDFTVTGHTGAITDIDVGDVIVQRGHPTTVARQNLIYRTVSDTDNPYERTLTGVNSIAAFTNLANVALQTGNLKSLASYGIMPASPGVGLYSSNAFLTGIAIIGTSVVGDSSVRITGSSFDDITSTSDDASLYFNVTSASGLYYRDFIVGDGKSWPNGLLIYCDGSAGRVGIRCNSNSEIDSTFRVNTVNGAGLKINYNATGVNYLYGTLISNSAIVTTGGIHVGGTSDPGADNLLVDGTATATNFILSSDERLKENIKSISYALPVNIDYKTFNLKSDPSTKRYGVIAQELQKTNPELVHIDSEGMLSVSYFDLLIKEVAYLKNKVIELERKIN